VKITRVLTATALACFAVLLVGCGSDSDSDSSSSSSTTTTKDAVCSDKTALENSVKDITNIDLTGGESAVESAVDKVKDNLDALGDSVKADLRPQVDDVKSAIDELETVVRNFGDGSLTDNLQDAGDAVAKVGSTSADLFSSLSAECPSS
jgi:ABC-type Fe3+-hydroxamate transport system substrate-binding protein